MCRRKGFTSVIRRFPEQKPPVVHVKMNQREAGALREFTGERRLTGSARADHHDSIAIITHRKFRAPYTILDNTVSCGISFQAKSTAKTPRTRGHAEKKPNCITTGPDPDTSAFLHLSVRVVRFMEGAPGEKTNRSFDCGIIANQLLN